MERFEYTTVFTDAKGILGGKVNQELFQQQLNALGAQGWELVSTVASAQDFGNTRWLISVFKRRL